MTEFGRWSVCDIHLLCELFFISFYLCDSLYGLFALSVRRHTDFYQLLRRLTITDTLSFIPSFSFLQNFYFFILFFFLHFALVLTLSHIFSLCHFGFFCLSQLSTNCLCSNFFFVYFFLSLFPYLYILFLYFVTSAIYSASRSSLSLFCFYVFIRSSCTTWRPCGNT